MRVIWIAIASFLGLAVMGCVGCSKSKYERLPEATKKESEAIGERYRALIDEARKLKGKDPFNLLHHFSHAALTRVQPDGFRGMAEKFISDLSEGKLDSISIQGARSPGKVRLLLVEMPGRLRAIPFVQGSDGWKLDDIEMAFGQGEREPNLEGSMPASPPSALGAISTLQDPQASETDKVQAAIRLSNTGSKSFAKRFTSLENRPWPMTALLYTAWKAGGKCEPFAKAFPTDQKAQSDLYQADTQSFRILLHGLFQCAASSKSLMPTQKIYQGCANVEAGPRSEYVDPLVGNPDAQEDALKLGLANLRPEFILLACLKAKLAFEKDPVANIVVHGLHGEKNAAFYQYIHKKARSGGKVGRLAKDWVDRMAKRDEIEPPE